MYSQPFYITSPVGNNALSFDQRTNKQLFVPTLKKISDFDEIQLLSVPSLNKGRLGEDGDKITFEDFGFDGKPQTCYGLENLYEIPPLTLSLPGEKKLQAPIYLVDNHNHVFYFWYLARSQGIISDDALLYHIDEHADTRDPGEYLLKPDSQDLQKVFEYTNYTLNVGNYIIPAEKEGLIGETIQIRSEHALEEYLCCVQELGKRSVILNLDLDFFSPGLDYIDYNLKKKVILDIAKKADVITVCTSPFFIEQERALEVFRDIFDKN